MKHRNMPCPCVNYEFPYQVSYRFKARISLVFNSLLFMLLHNMHRLYLNLFMMMMQDAMRAYMKEYKVTFADSFADDVWLETLAILKQK